jgi:hypothetical protein
MWRPRDEAKIAVTQMLVQHKCMNRTVEWCTVKLQWTKTSWPQNLKRLQTVRQYLFPNAINLKIALRNSTAHSHSLEALLGSSVREVHKCKTSTAQVHLQLTAYHWQFHCRNAHSSSCKSLVFTGNKCQTLSRKFKQEVDLYTLHILYSL